MVQKSTITGNIASGDGSHYARSGGVFSRNSIEVADSTLSDNEADSGGGAFILNAAVTPSLFLHCTISNNRVNGAGIFNGQNSVEVAQCTVRGDSAVFDFGAACISQTAMRA